MPLNFVRLKVAGFKSFVEPATIDISPGLTGIVGPNGCGKSNIVEALRWAMGESSAKSMRGSEMEDVIFAGTEKRPARNLAEVVITIDNSDGMAPPPLAAAPEIEISRRIERGQGSTYRVNGKEWRARDISTLLADAATGAHSSGLVSQGRVAALIAMSPENRRQLLEEAAGITGLHSRRHEAELKLRATEANLARLDDVKLTLEAQLAGLKKQARQASRWRNIGKSLAEAEALLLGIRHARAATQQRNAEAILQDAELGEAQAVEAVTGLAQAATAAAAELPALRQEEAQAREHATETQHQAEAVATELRVVEQALADARRVLQQIIADQDREGAIAADAKAAVERLAGESANLARAIADDPARLEAAELAHREAADLVAAAEAEAGRATELAAGVAAKLAALSAERAEAQARLARIGRVAAQLASTRAEVEARLVEAAALEEARSRHEAADARLLGARETLEAAERSTAAAREASAKAARAANEADARRSRLDAEARALTEVLGSRDGDLWPPLADAIAVPVGMEVALGAALGDALDSTADEAAQKFWRALPPLADPAPMPEGAKPFSSLVEAPPALARALTQAGLVDTDAIGEALQPGLTPGQVLVTADGAIFRWDGFSVRAGTPTPPAIRLAQRNRLKLIEKDLAEASQGARLAKQEHEVAAAAEGACIAAERSAREAARLAVTEADRARSAAQSLAAQATAASGRLAGLSEEEARLAQDRGDAEAALARAEQNAQSLQSLDAVRSNQAEARARQAEARAREGEARALLERQRSDGKARQVRAAAVASEHADWNRRSAGTADRLANLATRRVEAELAIQEAGARAIKLAETRKEAAARLAAAHESRQHATNALTAAEARSSAAAAQLHAAEGAASGAREARAVAQGSLAASVATTIETARAISDRFQVEPDSLLQALAEDGNEVNAEPQAETAVRDKVDRLVRERDGMGAVNLAAEQEAADVEARMDELFKERSELESSIAKLRTAIQALNKEGRERLTARFVDVNENFKKVFNQLFDGGSAHLSLTGSDDPLQAGLEVYASPPGKKLSSLALLSGGEQALTALSLIFAVFLCNPSPICVLDEVDAPLDEANTVRFCDMIKNISRDTGTRFIVVTHHRSTMSNMDNLYGVTMQQRGISTIVSVKLHELPGANRMTDFMHGALAAE